MNPVPKVSVVIPCRNEERFIGRCLDSFISGVHPKDSIEVLVVDGMSEDGTRPIVESYIQQWPFIRLIDNRRKITPVAMNEGIKAARGEVIIIAGAHAEYPRDFVSNSLACLRETGADVVGGPVITKCAADTLTAKAISLATSHPFGVGNSKFRTSQKEGYVDTVPFGAYRREVFEEVGLFDERLVRNQDNEMSTRIVKSGCKIYMTPKLTTYYYSQESLSGLLRHALRTGMWNVVTLSISHSALRWRHFIPFAFVSALLVFGGLGSVYPWARFALLALLGSYFGAAAFCSLQIGVKGEGKNALILPIVFFLYHAAYGVGSLFGMVKVAVSRWKSQMRSFPYSPA